MYGEILGFCVEFIEVIWARHNHEFSGRGEKDNASKVHKSPAVKSKK